MTRKQTPSRPSAADVWEALGFPSSPAAQLLDARLRGLRNLAQRVFVDRNAQGISEADRLKVKLAMRPHLRQAIHWARVSRDALKADDIDRHELLRDRARMYVAFARLEIFQPYANILGEDRKVRAVNSQKGGEVTKDKYAMPELDDLIDGCIARGDKMRSAVWAKVFDVTLRTVQRHIEARKAAAIKTK